MPIYLVGFEFNQFHALTTWNNIAHQNIQITGYKPVKSIYRYKQKVNLSRVRLLIVICQFIPLTLSQTIKINQQNKTPIPALISPS